MGRRLFLRRMGVIGGLGLVVATPWIARTKAGSSRDKDDPLELRFPALGYREHELTLDDGKVLFAIEIGFWDAEVQACLEGAEESLLQDVDAWLSDGGIDLLDQDGSYYGDDPQLVDLVAAQCQAPGPADDDDSAGSSPSDGYAWVALDYAFDWSGVTGGMPIEPEEELVGPGCHCTHAPRRRNRGRRR